MVKKHKNNTNFVAWCVWLFGALFFFFEYIIRLSPSIMVQDLLHDFNTTAFGLGALSMSFHYAYLGMQLPVGIMIDRYGPHRLLTFMCILSALGALLFAYAPNIWIAQVARFILGFGTAFAFVGTLKLCSSWFPIQRFAMLAGLTQAIGMLGAFVGEGPMSYVVASIGWRPYIVICGLCFVVLALLIGLIVRDHPQDAKSKEEHAHHEDGHSLLRGLKVVIKNPLTWVFSIYGGLLYAPTTAFAELWGATYLETVFHIDHHYAATLVSLMFLGWFLGAPLIGWVAQRVKKQKNIMTGSAIAGLLIMSCFVFLPEIPKPLLPVLAFLYGLTNTGLILAYAAAGFVNPKKYTGTALAFANISSVIVGVFLQPIIGKVLDLTWNGQLSAEGHRIFDPFYFRISMVSLPICFLVAAIISAVYIKEKNISHHQS